MLFNSSVFLFAFLPLTIIGFYILARRAGASAAKVWLCLASFVFYGWWNPAFVLLLTGSIAFNYTLSLFLKDVADDSDRSQSLLLAAGVAANLFLLFYFKYLFQTLGFLHGLGWISANPSSVILPLGISFFTFTQVGYLVDCRQGLVKERGLLNYILFVTFFPHLIAGPILHHREIMPQFASEATYRFKAENLATGLTLFSVGMFKKVVFADAIAPWAETGFSHVPGTAFLHAWSVALAYAMQLYFDFSGYSDMAIALGIMFGVRLPLNFNSPYKSTSIIEYWQRFHMTLTRYLTLLLYNPMSLWVARRRSLKGRPAGRQAASTPMGFASMIVFPTMTTMLLAGIWHGAGLQYLIFGLLHGTYMSINHAWRIFFPVSSKPVVPPPAKLLRCWSAVWPVVMTFVAVVVAQIFFRAASTRDALAMLGAMSGANGSGLPLPISAQNISDLGLVQQWLVRHHLLILSNAEGYNSVTLPLAHNALLIILLGCIAFGAPNVYQIMDKWSPALTKVRSTLHRLLLWHPNWRWALLSSVMLFWATLRFDHPARFLYFQF
jgi:D-alanyl-lipoteichoic acid acyltransferase DltB (MBOAT superfamily)